MRRVLASSAADADAQVRSQKERSEKQRQLLISSRSGGHAARTCLRSLPRVHVHTTQTHNTSTLEASASEIRSSRLASRFTQFTHCQSDSDSDYEKLVEWGLQESLGSPLRVTGRTSSH